jgi:hypothetical protein
MNTYIMTGYFAKVGKRVASKVHIVAGGFPLCHFKSNYGPEDFQWCSHDIFYEYLTCEKCKQLARKILKDK